MSLRLPEGMEKSSIGKFATFATAISVVDKDVSLFYYITQTQHMKSAKNKETVKMYLNEAEYKDMAKNVPGAAAKKYNTNVKQFLKVTKAHSKETAKLYIYMAKGDAERAIEKYKADVEKFCDFTKTDEKFAEECLRDAKCNVDLAIGEFNVLKFRAFTKTDEKTARKFLDETSGNFDKAINEYLVQFPEKAIEIFCDITETDEKTAKKFLYEAEGNTLKAIKNYNVSVFRNVTEADEKTAEKCLKKALRQPGSTLGDHARVAINNFYRMKRWE